MDEIRAKVRLRNAIDEALARHGRLPAGQIRTYEANAVVDANSVRCTIPPRVAEQLGVSVRGQRIVKHGGGPRAVAPLTGPIFFEILGRDAVEESLILGDEVRIGHTVLAKLHLLPDRANGRLIPNPAHPDQPVTKVK
jgi:hypothetical protein